MQKTLRVQADPQGFLLFGSLSGLPRRFLAWVLVTGVLGELAVAAGVSHAASAGGKSAGLGCGGGFRVTGGEGGGGAIGEVWGREQEVLGVTGSGA